MTSSRAAIEAEKDRREELCAAIVCDVLGGGARWEKWDIRGGPPGRNDFNILFPDERREALEVSAYTDEPAEKQRAALEENDRRESQVLKRVWFVSIPDRGLNLGELHSGQFHDRIEAALVLLESQGYERFLAGEFWSITLRLGSSTPSRRHGRS
jgi:hypothetical protein